MSKFIDRVILECLMLLGILIFGTGGCLVIASTVPVVGVTLGWIWFGWLTITLVRYVRRRVKMLDRDETNDTAD